MNWFMEAMRKYAQFSGRSRRSEYWYFQLITAVIGIVLLVLTLVTSGVLQAIFGILLAVFFLATLIPSIAVLVRRLHDTGKSGWYYFVSLIPVVGGFVLLYFLVTDSEPGQNQYGVSPKHAGV